MFKVEFFRDQNGKEPVTEYLLKLKKDAERDKDSRIKFKKIYEYIEIISKYGATVGEPIVKNIKGPIWEIRPTNDRIFFFFYQENRIVLLHHYRKKTQKTPKREIEHAIRNMNEYLTQQNNSV